MPQRSEACQYPQHRAYDWHLIRPGQRRARGPVTCGICHPPPPALVEAGEVRWLRSPAPPRPAQIGRTSVREAADRAQQAEGRGR